MRPLESRTPSWRRAGTGPVPPLGLLPGLALVLAGCGGSGPPDPSAGPDAAGTDGNATALSSSTHEPPPLCPAVGRGTPLPLVVDTVATGLEVPWDLAFLPDGRILVTERGGAVRVVEADARSGAGTVRSDPWASFPVAHVAEAGLLGIDLAPDHAATGHVYLTYTYQDVPEGAFHRIVAALGRRIARLTGSAAGQVWTNRVVRLTDGATGGRDPEVILDGLPSGPVHAGGALRFGPDGRLHLGLGEGGEPGRSADPTSPGGAILRLEADGTPAGVPDPDSPVLAWGFRNPQGLAWTSGDVLLAIDHGPTGGVQEGLRRHADELNRVLPGGDHGWPAAAGMESVEGSVLPLLEWTPAIAPAGLAVVDAPGSPWDGDAFVTGLRGQGIRRLVLDGPEPRAVLCEEPLLPLESGRLRAIRQGPDGHLWVATSNRDQRGSPGTLDDLLLRIHLPADAFPPAPEDP